MSNELKEEGASSPNGKRKVDEMEAATPTKRKRGRPPKKQKLENATAKATTEASDEESESISLVNVDAKFFPEDIKESFRTILNSVTERNLSSLLKANHISAEDAETKKEMIDLIVYKATKVGAESLFSIPSDLIKTSVAEFKKAAPAKVDAPKMSQIDFAGSDNKAFQSAVTVVGVEHFLYVLPETMLDGFIRALRFEEQGNQEQKVDAILEEAFLAGAKQILNNASREVLQAIVKELGLDVRNATKQVLVRRMLALEFPHLDEEKEEEEEEEVPTPKKKRGRAKTVPEDKRPIEKGITSEELSKNYTQQELIDFSRKNKLKYGMKKNELIKNIWKFINGEPGVEKAVGKRGRPPKKKKQQAESEASEEEQDDASASSVPDQ